MSTLALSNHVNGRAQPPAGDRWLDVFDPATATAYARCPASDARSCYEEVGEARPLANVSQEGGGD